MCRVPVKELGTGTLVALVALVALIHLVLEWWSGGEVH
jgi:hypothetical protein